MKQTLILKVVRIFLLGVLSSPAGANQPTPTAALATLDAPTTAAVVAPAPAPVPEEGEGMPLRGGAGGAAETEGAAVAAAAALNGGAAGGGGGGIVGSAKALPPSLSSTGVTGGDAAGLDVSCSSSTETEMRLSPEESTLEDGIQSPLQGGDRGDGGGGGKASTTFSGPEFRERGSLWACLPVDVTAAVLAAVELPELQVLMESSDDWIVVMPVGS